MKSRRRMARPLVRDTDYSDLKLRFIKPGIGSRRNATQWSAAPLVSNDV